jgi:hypothetical protein
VSAVQPYANFSRPAVEVMPDVLKLDRFKEVNAEHPLNISYMPVALLVFQLPVATDVRAEQPLNTEFMSVTLETFQFVVLTDVREEQFRNT